MTRRLPSRLYAIADPGEDDRDPVDLARRLLEGGARIVQLRDKRRASGELHRIARECRRLASAAGALLFVNDRVDLAMAANADGVHLGQTDLPASAARRLLGADRWIGVSTHDVAEARAAAEAGADYIGFGPLFATATKATGYTPRGLAALGEVRAAVSLPIVAIGGIGPANARAAIEAGADAVAIISALRDSPNVVAAVKNLLHALESA